MSYTRSMYIVDTI